MSNDKRSATTETKASDAKVTRSTETILNKEQEQGFRGVEVDPTPNENYTIAGVTNGAPTPETDAELAKDVRQSTGLGLSALEASAREKAATKRGAK
jgi:hypothetical protein